MVQDYYFSHIAGSGNPILWYKAVTVLRYFLHDGRRKAGLRRKKGGPDEAAEAKQIGSWLEHQLALELDDASRRQTGEERSVRTGRRSRGV